MNEPVRYKGRLIGANALFWLSLAIAVPAIAADGDNEDPVSRLRAIEKQIEISRTRADTLEAEALQLAQETARLSKRLIATASRIQAREAQITTAEKRLTKLGTDEVRVKGRLIRRRAVLADLLAGLQRLEQNPPPALAVRPEDALDAVRSAMLLGVIVPELRVEANALAQDLNRLKRLRRSIAREQTFLNENLASLGIERKEIAELIEVKRKTSKLTADEISTERTRLASLAKKAKTFRGLISSLRTEKLKAEKKPQSKAQKVAARASGLVKPSIEFTKAKGSLAFPAQGVKIRQFGAKDGFGGTAKGLSIATRSQSQITTPIDGWIVYSGPFRSYGQLLIINAGEGYHILLAGMDRIDVDTGQFVRSGEPVGIMGENAASSAAVGDVADNDRPILYVEFRNSGNPIDPGPWWAGGDEKVRG